MPIYQVKTKDGAIHPTSYQVLLRFWHREYYIEPYSYPSGNATEITISGMSSQEWLFLTQLLSQLQLENDNPSDPNVLAERGYDFRLQAGYEPTIRELSALEQKLMSCLENGELRQLLRIAKSYQEKYCMDRICTMIGNRLENLINTMIAMCYEMCVDEDEIANTIGEFVDFHFDA